MGASIVPRRSRPRDVFLSDFIQDFGTPLQWLLAWEAVAERVAREVEAAPAAPTSPQAAV